MVSIIIVAQWFSLYSTSLYAKQFEKCFKTVTLTFYVYPIIMFQTVSGWVSFNLASLPFLQLKTTYTQMNWVGFKLAVGPGCNALQEKVGGDRIQPETMFPVIIS